MLSGRRVRATQKSPVGEGILPSILGVKYAVRQISAIPTARPVRVHLVRHQPASMPDIGSDVAIPSAKRLKMWGSRTLIGRWYKKYDEASSGWQNEQFRRVSVPNLRYSCLDLAI